jgi:hypothetical protein
MGKVHTAVMWGMILLCFVFLAFAFAKSFVLSIQNPLSQFIDILKL